MNIGDTIIYKCPYNNIELECRVLNIDYSQHMALILPKNRLYFNAHFSDISLPDSVVRPIQEFILTGAL